MLEWLNNIIARALRPRTKLITHNTEGVNLPDDVTYPFKLEIRLSIPVYMQVSFVSIMRCGCERIVVRGDTLRDLERYVKKYYADHPRLLRYNITGKDDAIVYEQEAAAPTRVAV